MQNLSKYLIIFGVLIAGIGVLLTLFGKVPYMGKLPGDIYMEGKNFKFYFPLASCIVVSIILTILFKLFLKK